MIYSIIISLFVAFISTLNAGVYGTLAGQVVDEQSGEGLAYVNIVIEGAGKGGITDEDGYFLINHIPSGSYTVSAQIMGYKTENKRDVKILVDLRTKLVFKLKPVSLDLGEEIVVTAEQPLLQKDVTATTHFISNEELKTLPLKNYKQAIDIQPGVAAGHIRGGRKDEVLYLVDGLPVKEAIEGEIGTDLPNSAIVDMTVQTGGFNAEYGNAMSGVVNIITKEGTENFFSHLELSATYLNNEPRPFSANHQNDYEVDFSAGGPITDKLQYFISSNALYPNSRWKKEEFGVKRLIYTDVESQNFNVAGKLTYHIDNSTKINVQGLLSLWDWTEYDHQWKFNLSGLSPQSKKSYRLNVFLSHAFSNDSYLNLYVSQYNVLKAVYGKSSEEQEPVIHETDESGNEDPLGYVISGDYPWWMDHEEIHNLIKVDFVKQMNFNHQIKFGGEAIFYYLYKKNVFRKELFRFDPKFPRYITYDTEYEYRPNQGSFYIQDKIDYEFLTLNLGLRYDFFNPRARRPVVEQDVTGVDSVWIVSPEESTPASIKHQFSPRVGFSLPASANSEFRINYGYFFQMPQFEYLYTNSNLNVAYGFAAVGDPDLKPARTVAIEAGYRVSFDDLYLLDITFFNKDVTNLVDSNTFLNADPQFGGAFSYGLSRFVNSSAVNIRGMELFFKRRFHRKIGGKISYTYMYARGTGSSAVDAINWQGDTYRIPNDQFPLSWDQRHTIVLDFSYSLWNRWRLNTLYRWNSGLPYTKFKGYGTVPNNARLSSTQSFDIRIARKFQWNTLALYMFGELYNAFDNRNILWADINGKPGGHLEDISAWDMGRHIQFGLIINL